MKDVFKIIILLIILVAMVAGFWFLFKDQKIFEHKKKDEQTIEEVKETVDEDKESISDEIIKENVEEKEETVQREETKKQDTKKTETKTTTKTETKQESSTQNKTNTTNDDNSNNTQIVLKSYSKPRCVFSGEDDNYNYIMTYVGYFDTNNNNLMDKVTINYQYAPKEGKFDSVKKEAQEEINEHKGFSGGYKVQDGYVLVHLEGDAKAFSKVYLESTSDIVDRDTFTYIMSVSGATCYNA